MTLKIPEEKQPPLATLIFKICEKEIGEIMKKRLLFEA